MMVEYTKFIKCSKCGYIFGNGELGQPAVECIPCPKCGSLNRNICITIEAKIGSAVSAKIVEPDVTIKKELDLLASQKIEKRKPGSKHKKHRPDYELTQGKKIGEDGKLVDKKVIMNREHPDSPHSYIEIIKDKDGNVIVHKDEKLSKHREV